MVVVAEQVPAADEVVADEVAVVPVAAGHERGPPSQWPAGRGKT